MAFSFKSWKTQLVLFERSYKFGAIDVKMNWSALKEKFSFKMMGLSFFSKLGYIVSFVKTAFKKMDF